MSQNMASCANITVSIKVLLRCSCVPAKLNAPNKVHLLNKRPLTAPAWTLVFLGCRQSHVSAVFGGSFWTCPCQTLPQSAGQTPSHRTRCDPLQLLSLLSAPSLSLAAEEDNMAEGFWTDMYLNVSKPVLTCASMRARFSSSSFFLAIFLLSCLASAKAAMKVSKIAKNTSGFRSDLSSPKCFSASPNCNRRGMVNHQVSFRKPLCPLCPTYHFFCLSERLLHLRKAKGSHGDELADD